ncbi:MAG: hypothetical protein OXG16_08260 [Rhodospirillales bacterium]|nr:hypothetical protein [Rhodospirillales bacterium]
MQPSRLFPVSGHSVLSMWGAVSVSAQDDGQQYADPMTAVAPADGCKIPLASSDRRRLLSLMAPPRPHSLPGGPEITVKVEAREAIDGALEPIMPDGTVEPIGDRVSTGLCVYALTNARRVS